MKSMTLALSVIVIAAVAFGAGYYLWGGPSGDADNSPSSGAADAPDRDETLDKPEQPTADDSSPGETEPEAPDPADDESTPNTKTELGEVPTGQLTDSGLKFVVPYERGDGSLVLSKQNDMLRADVVVRLPYSGGDGARDRGSSLTMSLSVDGKHGRHLFYFPNAVWAPNPQGSLPTYGWDASFSQDGDVTRLDAEKSFGAAFNTSYWAKWEATLWIDLRYVLIPGNSVTELANNWRLSLVTGNQSATVMFPEGVDLQNPANTPKRMVTFKYDQLPEREELEDNPREKAIETEADKHTRMKAIVAEFNTRDLKGGFDRASKASEAYPEALWPKYLLYQLSRLADNNSIEGVDHDFMARQKSYVNTCPGQSAAHLDYLDSLLTVDRIEDAEAHAKAIFESPMCTEREETHGFMQLEWAKRLINWGYVVRAENIMTGLDENESLMNRDRFRLDYKFQLAAMAEREGDSKTAAEVYEGLLTEETEHLDGQQTQAAQSLLQFQKEAVESWENELAAREADAKKTNPRLVVETSEGKIVIELFEDDAPNTVSALVKLARSNFYDGLSFHRIVPGFVAQGGCPNGDGSGSPGYRLKFEENDRKHFRGSIAMARSQSKDSAGCQFYICLANSPQVINLNDNYVVVGRVIEGMEVADQLRVGDSMESVTAENLRDHEYEPETLPE